MQDVARVVKSKLNENKVLYDAPFISNVWTTGVTYYIECIYDHPDDVAEKQAWMNIEVHGQDNGDIYMIVYYKDYDEDNGYSDWSKEKVNLPSTDFWELCYEHIERSYGAFVNYACDSRLNFMISRLVDKLNFDVKMPA